MNCWISNYSDTVESSALEAAQQGMSSHSHCSEAVVGDTPTLTLVHRYNLNSSWRCWGSSEAGVEDSSVAPVSFSRWWGLWDDEVPLTG